MESYFTHLILLGMMKGSCTTTIPVPICFSIVHASTPYSSTEIAAFMTSRHSDWPISGIQLGPIELVNQQGKWYATWNGYFIRGSGTTNSCWKYTVRYVQGSNRPFHLQVGYMFNVLVRATTEKDSFYPFIDRRVLEPSVKALQYASTKSKQKCPFKTGSPLPIAISSCADTEVNRAVSIKGLAHDTGITPSTTTSKTSHFNQGSYAHPYNRFGQPPPGDTESVQAVLETEERTGVPVANDQEPTEVRPVLPLSLPTPDRLYQHYVTANQLIRQHSLMNPKRPKTLKERAQATQAAFKQEYMHLHKCTANFPLSVDPSPNPASEPATYRSSNNCLSPK